MWKQINGRLVQTIDSTRAEYKTRVSKTILDELKKIANEHNTHVGYLLESGFENLLRENYVKYDKKKRPKDRVEFRTTCDENLLESLRGFAKDNKLNLNDVIEISAQHINLEEVKKGNWRYRIEH